MVSAANPTMLAAIIPTASLARFVDRFSKTITAKTTRPAVHPSIDPRLTVVIRLKVNEPVTRTRAASQ